jgi:hypothetical protein
MYIIRNIRQTSQLILYSQLFLNFWKGRWAHHKKLREIHEITLILPELLIPDNEGGDTDDNIKRESSGLGQCTKRLLLPNASRANHSVFESVWKFNMTWMLGNRICSKMQTSQHHNFTCLPVYQSPWSFDGWEDLWNWLPYTLTARVCFISINSVEVTTAARFQWRQKWLSIILIIGNLNSSIYLTLQWK